MFFPQILFALSSQTKPTMKPILISLLLLNFFIMQAQDTPTIKSVLLKQFKTTHNQKEWFVPVSVAVEGVTAQQAVWQDGSGNHSIGQLANHIAFWDGRLLRKFNGEKEVEFSGDNEETFNSFDEKKWTETLKRLEEVLTGWEQAIAAADEKKLKDWYENIANMNTHNAYHTGQIVFIRKLQKNWNAEKGVK